MKGSLGVACLLALFPIVGGADPMEPAPVHPSSALTERCITLAASRGLPPMKWVVFRNKRSDNLEIFAQDFVLQSITSGQERVICRHDIASGRLALFSPDEAALNLYSIWPVDLGKGHRGDPSSSSSIAACVQSAESKGYRVKRIADQTNLREYGRLVARLVQIDARREGHDRRLDCTFAFADRSIQITER